MDLDINQRERRPSFSLLSERRLENNRVEGRDEGAGEEEEGSVGGSRREIERGARRGPHREGRLWLGTKKNEKDK